jgi:hypothetical protein
VLASEAAFLAVGKLLVAQYFSTQILKRNNTNVVENYFYERVNAKDCSGNIT